jgi:hypothetical protein
MNIGIDIDNVISNFDEALLEEYLKHDNDLRGTGIVNKNLHMTEGMFDWTEKEEREIYLANIERIVKKLNVKDGAKEYIDKLKQDGYNIFIITGRDNGEYTNPVEMTKKWLNENNIYYDKLIFTNAYKNDKHGKTEKCFENNIDIMIDDSVHICKDCMENNITTLLMDRVFTRKEKGMTKVKDWKEIYEFISNYKINVILDTDTYNECDDQFALIEGVIFPDSVKDKSLTHYGPRSSYSNLKLFLEDKNDMKDDFTRGYFEHLLTDYLFYNKYIDTFSKAMYDDYDLLNSYLIEKYNVKLPEKVKKQVFYKKEGMLKILSKELVEKFIKEVSELDLDKVAEEIKNNPEKWTKIRELKIY